MDWSTAWAIAAAYAVCFAANDKKSSEPIGEVLGKPLYRKQLNNDAAGDVKRLFMTPLWNKFLEQNAAQIEPSEQEIRAFLKWSELELEAERPELEKRFRITAQRRAQSGLSEQEQRKLHDEQLEIKRRLKSPDRFFAHFWLAHWKQQRFFYDRFGGGRVNFQQPGLEAFDGMQKWLRDSEENGDFKFFDPSLRAGFYAYWDPSRHHFADENEVDDFLLHPTWTNLLNSGDKAPVDTAAAKDLELLQGRWQTAASEIDGQAIAEDELQPAVLIVKGTELEMILDASGNRRDKFLIRLDPSGTPKTIDLIGFYGSRKERTILGIYNVERGLFRICIRDTPAKTKGRPKTFKTEAESGLGHLTFERPKE